MKKADTIKTAERIKNAIRSCRTVAEVNACAAAHARDIVAMKKTQLGRELVIHIQNLAKVKRREVW